MLDPFIFPNRPNPTQLKPNSSQNHLLRPLDPLEAAVEKVVVVGHGLLDVGRARLVEGGVDGVRDGPLGPDEEGVVAETVSGA